MTQAPRALARRYARALLEVASVEGSRAVLALRDELRDFVPQLTGHAQLRLALAHPGLRADQKRKLVLALAERAKVSALAKRLVELLSSRDRLSLLAAVAEEYAKLANEAQNVVAAEAVTALPLAPAQKKALEAALKGDAASVELSERVDPAIVGGLVVRAFGRTYDGSVRTRLSALRRRLAAS
jgi:F-type H+-transporting ATPase subunit delta